MTTGQQPGLFGGPIYTWAKALSALALADAIEGATGIPAAPVFWAATDDADFAEARVTQVALPGGSQRLVLRATAPEGTPMAAVPLADDVDGLLRVLERGARSAPYAPALDEARRAYHPGASVGGAYCELLRALLEPCGVAVLDASHPSVRAAAFPLLAAALAGAARVDEALAVRSREIDARGHAPQVSLVPGLSLVFANAAGGSAKQRIAIDDAAAAMRRAAPGDLSPNVLLRPVVEQALLPTVAYLAGPGELAYFAQVSAVARALGAPAPLALPRWSGTILEAHVLRILERLSIGEDELRTPYAAEARLAREASPAALRAALADARAAVDALAERLQRSPETSALVPPAVVEGASRTLALRLDRLERRYLAAVKRRERAMLQDVATARGALYPGGIRQERALNFLPFLARYGESLLTLMRERAADHAALVAGLERAPRTVAAPT